MSNVIGADLHEKLVRVERVGRQAFEGKESALMCPAIRTFMRAKEQGEGGEEVESERVIVSG